MTVTGSASTQSSPASTPVTSQSQQMLAILSPVLNRPNGRHQISIEMHPADLGTIQATVTVQSGHVTVELSADHPGARQALGTALPDLRQQLGSGGRNADVFLGGGTRGGSSGNDSQLSLSTQTGISASPLLVTSQGVTSRTSVDLRL
ncbi:MAG: flagellar hook-length control protein FliK [Acidimicrobiales bacterium]